MLRLKASLFHIGIPNRYHPFDRNGLVQLQVEKTSNHKRDTGVQITILVLYLTKEQCCSGEFAQEGGTEYSENR